MVWLDVWTRSMSLRRPAFGLSAAATGFLTVHSRTASALAADAAPPVGNEPMYDVAFVGGGIVGLAAARALKMQHPNLSMIILEKESELATHQTGHNSGVIHSGVYYTPGSLKAKLCVEGNRRTYEYCESHGITIRKTGKLIVAVEEEEVERLKKIFERGKQNGVPGIEYLEGEDKVKAIEPHCCGSRRADSFHWDRRLASGGAVVRRRLQESWRGDRVQEGSYRF